MNQLSRRRVITLLAAGASSFALPRWAVAEPAAVRTIDFSHLHTGERLAVEYFNGGTYLPDALRAVNQLLRDFRTGEVHAIDPELLDLLHAVRDVTGSRRPLEVI